MAITSARSTTADADGRRAGVVRRRPSRLTSTQVERLWALVFLSPWFVGFLGLMIGPMLWSLWLSFTNYDPLRGHPRWIGLENYREAFADERVRTSLRNTLFYTVIHVPLTVVIGLALAMMLTRIRRFSGFFRTLFYLPNVTPAVAVGTLFLLLLNGRQGLLNKSLDLVGINGPSWLNDPAWMKFGVIMMMAWTVGTTVVIFFAALQNVPASLYEAAAIDGATPWKQFRHVTVPMISGTIFFGAQPTSANQEAVLFYTVYLFEQAFKAFRMGYASALAWLLFIVVGIITAIQVRVSKRWVHYEDASHS